jgi:hypothetical protein
MRATVIAGDILLWMLPVAFWCALKLGRWNAGTSAPASTSKRSARTLVGLSLQLSTSNADNKYATDDRLLLSNAPTIPHID